MYHFFINMSFDNIIKSSFAGSTAGIIQLTSLFWLKTLTKHQYRHGTSLPVSFSQLYKEKDILRFYRGFLPNLVKVSLGKFGDAALYTYFHQPDFNYLSNEWRTTYIAFTSSFIKFNLMPFDTYTNMYQVRGTEGSLVMKQKIKKDGIRVLYNGSAAFFLSNFLGNASWFYTLDCLNSKFYESSYLFIY